MVFINALFGLISLFLCINLVECWSDNRIRRFPDDFKFGVASSAYQIEGGWNAGGKGESIWDHLTHSRPESISDNSNADEAANSYEFYKRDVQMLRELGVDMYRFSISWPRLFPEGFTDKLNQGGLDYYNNLINELLANNIEPVITLYHWDLPQKLQDLGGWTNPMIVTYFDEYAKKCFELFGDRVKMWISVNQPDGVCLGYEGNLFAPAINLKKEAFYLCVKHVLLAHAKTWHTYKDEFKSKQKGKLGITIAINWADPKTNETIHQAPTEDFRQFDFGFYMNPLFSKKGDFPEKVKSIVAKNSKTEGLLKSRLPELTSDEVKYIKGSADFLGMNHYTTQFVHKSDKENSEHEEINVGFSFGEQWKKSRSPWLRNAAYGLYKALIYLHQNYQFPEIYITENGWSTGQGLQDDDRVEYYRNYMFSLLLALEDGAKVKGYFAWSLLDNFEWNVGYTERFGLYEVDFDSPKKTRTARKSALVYKEIIKSRIVDISYEPKGSDITTSKKKKKEQKKEEKDEL